MRLRLIDPSDAGSYGAWTNPDPLDMAAVAAGQPFMLQHDSTSSGSADELYNMAGAPSFSGPVMALGYVGGDGVLHLFLAASSDDYSCPLADLASFKDAAGGSGDLFRSNRLPVQINWDVAA